MKKFAKLFETETYGQVLVRRDNQGDTGPRVCISAWPPGFGVCDVVLEGWGDHKDGNALADRTFEAIDQAGAEKFADGMFKEVNDFMNSADNP